MRSKIISLSSVIIIAMVSMSVAQEAIFNGKNLTGWTIFGTERWYVEDGILVGESGLDKEYGYLRTDKHYKNFELNLEFKQESEGNSGVFFRSSVEGTAISGWQVEIAPMNTGGVYESYGRGWLIKPDPEKANFLKVGEWNHMRIVVHDVKITTWLNDQEMISFEDKKIGAGKGSIALQIHSGGDVKVKWRNLNVLER